MTLFDLLFVVSFLVSAGALMRLVYLLARRRLAAARTTAIRLAVFLVIYAAGLAAVSLLSPQEVLSIGQAQCFDEWCITVIGASRQQTLGDVPASGVFYVVAVRISSRSRGRPQREADVYTYLTDGRGRRFDIAPAGQRALERAGLAGAPLTSFVDPGGSFESRLAFDVPQDATNLGFIKTSHGRFPTLVIIGDPSSFLHRPTIVRLDTF